MDKGGGVVKCPHLSTRGGEGVEIGQNLVHVVVECLPIEYKLPNKQKFLKKNRSAARLLGRSEYVKFMHQNASSANLNIDLSLSKGPK